MVVFMSMPAQKISKEGVAGYFQWLKSEYGFAEDRIKPYTFNPQPFLADKKSVMQGYVTSEPYAVEKAAGSSRTSSCSPIRASTPIRP